jgi:hypothetical protein
MLKEEGSRLSEDQDGVSVRATSSLYRPSNLKPQRLLSYFYKFLGLPDVFLWTADYIPDRLFFFRIDILGLQMPSRKILSKNSVVQRRSFKKVSIIHQMGDFIPYDNSDFHDHEHQHSQARLKFSSVNLSFLRLFKLPFE